MRSETEASQINEFRYRLNGLIGEQKPFEWAKSTGIPSSTFDRIWNHGAIPRPEHLVKISRRCGVSVDWLLTGKDSREKTRNRPGTVSIPMLKCSAEGNVIIDDKTEFLSLPLSFFVRRVSQSHLENLGIVEVRGDSMEPTLHNGDFVIVDQSQCEISGGIMALAWNGIIHLRRIATHPSGGVIINDNAPKYPNVDMDLDQLDRLTVIGKVVWGSQTF